VLEYDPSEFTFTALAGTRLSEVGAHLARHGQYLPFDPPFIETGATLGGTVAAGLSGSGRYHYGSLRDFLIGVLFIDGEGRLMHGGGKVVKNAAGFDFPKLMIGSRGSLGILVELTFKVFPRPKSYATLSQRYPQIEDALQVAAALCGSQVEIDSIDIETGEDGYTVWVRLGGWESSMPARIERLSGIIKDHLLLDGSEDEQLWKGVREMSWVPPGWSLVKVPITPGRIPALEAALARKTILRRYIAAGQCAWLALEEAPEALQPILSSQNLSGVPLISPAYSPLLGDFSGKPFYQRIKKVLDPTGRFVEVA
jgi:glycolate oxidase FAD binding subunit